MSAKAETSSRNNRIKDIAITAAVASVVSALVAPWVRRWMDAGGLGPSPQPQTMPQLPAGQAAQPTDDFDLRFQRILEVPDPFVPMAGRRRVAPRASWQPQTDERSEDDEDDDPEP